MHLVRIGNVGINFDNVGYWELDDRNQDGTPETLQLFFVGGGGLTLKHEQASALRVWLERNASGLGPVDMHTHLQTLREALNRDPHRKRQFAQRVESLGTDALEAAGGAALGLLV